MNVLNNFAVCLLSSGRNIWSLDRIDFTHRGITGVSLLDSFFQIVDLFFENIFVTFISRNFKKKIIQADFDNNICACADMFVIGKWWGRSWRSRLCERLLDYASLRPTEVSVRQDPGRRNRHHLLASVIFKWEALLHIILIVIVIVVNMKLWKASWLHFITSSEVSVRQDPERGNLQYLLSKATPWIQL